MNPYFCCTFLVLTFCFLFNFAKIFRCVGKQAREQCNAFLCHECQAFRGCTLCIVHCALAFYRNSEKYLLFSIIVQKSFRFCQVAAVSITFCCCISCYIVSKNSSKSIEMWTINIVWNNESVSKVTKHDRFICCLEFFFHFFFIFNIFLSYWFKQNGLQHDFQQISFRNYMTQRVSYDSQAFTRHESRYYFQLVF